MQSHSPIRVAMLSYAHTAHAVSYASALGRIDGVELAAIYDDDAARGASYAKEAGAPFYSDLNQVLKQDDIQGVIVCSETNRHKDLVCAAARAGKHVLCEKPLATTLEDARLMDAVCREAGVLFQVAYVCRFYPIVQTARRLVQQGDIGNVIGIIGGNRGRPPLPPMYPDWITDAGQAGGGALLDHSVHVTDAMRFILREEAATVFAEKSEFRPLRRNVDDCGLITLTFQDGVIATVDPSWSMPENNPYHYDFYLWILGEKGTLVIDDTRQTLHVVSDRPDRRAINAEPFGMDVDTELVRHFVACIRHGQHLFPAASAEDGLHSLEIALAAYRSAEVHQPVTLPLEIELK